MTTKSGEVLKQEELIALLTGQVTDTTNPRQIARIVLARVETAQNEGLVPTGMFDQRGIEKKRASIESE